MPLEILRKQAIRLRRPVNVISGRAKPLAEASGVRRRVLCMITSELFWSSTKLWQLFLLESWAILLTVVVRIREEILPRFQTLWCWIIRRRNSSIGSRKSRYRAAYKSTPQPLTRPHGPGRGRGRCGAYLFEPEIEAGEEAEMQGAVPGCSCWLCFADDHDDVEQRLGNNDSYIYHYFYSQFIIFGCVIREKRDLSQHSQTRTSWTRSLALAPARPVRPCQGLRGWLCASVEAADHQCWLVVFKHCKFCVFSVDYGSNMYNSSIHELYILSENLYICPHNRKVHCMC